MLPNTNECKKNQYFVLAQKTLLREYLELPDGIPSHDTIQRVMRMLELVVFRRMQSEWNEVLNRGEGEKLHKIINIGGKTML